MASNSTAMQNLIEMPFAKQNELLRDPDPEPNAGVHYVGLPGDYLIRREMLKDYVNSQLNVKRLNVIHNKLWRAGIPGKVERLHHQKLLQRSIVVTERVDLHLVWMNDRIFIKPLPTFLVNYNSYRENVFSNATLHASALGILHSYQKMLQHHIDFTMAQEYGLIPSTVTWRAWGRFRADLETSITRPQQINKRYHYGELRLSKLNLIYRFHLGEWRGGYFLVHKRYQSFFIANFKWLVLAFAYLSVILSALQVLLAANQAQNQENSSKALRGISIVIGAASTFSVVIAVSIMAALLVILIIVDEVFARSKRLGHNDESDLYQSIF